MTLEMEECNFRNSERTKQKRSQTEKRNVWKSNMFTSSRFGSSGCDGKKDKYTNWKNTTHPTKQRKNYEPGDGRVKV